jgi:hypothetical protein
MQLAAFQPMAMRPFDRHNARMNDAQIPTATRRFPMRFSLRRLLTLIAFAALILGLVVSRRREAMERISHELEIKKLKEAHKRENLTLRRRVAQLEDIAGWPSDPDRTHVAAGVARIGILDTWLCHLRQPPKRRLVLHYALDGIPDSGLPESDGSIPLGLAYDAFHGDPITDRTIAIMIAEVSDSDPKEYGLRIYADSITFYEIKIPDAHLLHRIRSGESLGTATDNAFRMYPSSSDTPLVLLKIIDDPRNRTDGLMVWIEDAAKPPR